MKRCCVLVACLLSAAMISGCSTRWVQSPVVDEKKLTVSLEHRVVKGEIAQKQFNHPYDMDSRDLKILLARLDYLEAPAFYGDPEARPVFQKEEIERLVPALTAALDRAAPHQRVRFVSYNRGGGLFFRKDRKTRGVLFVKPGNRLNLAFSYVNHEIREKELQRFSKTEETLNPLEIKSSDTPIVAPDYAGHKRTEDGEKYPMWLVADIEKIEQARMQEENAAEPGKAGESGTPAQTPAAESLSEPEPSSDRSLPEQTAPAVQPETSAKTPDDSWKSRKADIKERLEYLKELYESDLIDAQEYEAQKKKLLEQLELE